MGLRISAPRWVFPLLWFVGVGVMAWAAGPSQFVDFLGNNPVVAAFLVGPPVLAYLTGGGKIGF